MELGQRLDALADRPGDCGDPRARDLDHVLGDVDAGDPVAAARQVLGEPAGPAADVQHLGTQPEPEVVDDVRERPQAGGELEVRRGAERLRAQPERVPRCEVRDVLLVAAVEVLADAAEAAALRRARPPDAGSRRVSVRACAPRLATDGRLRGRSPLLELFLDLFRRDFAVRYRGSVLGVAWTMINPLA